MPDTSARPAHLTPYADLNDLLAGFVGQVADVLADDLVDAYLQGSFALGDGASTSDCDFLVVVRRPVTDAQERDLRAVHAEIPTRGTPWSRDLEGAYPVLDELATLDGLGCAWLYVDRGHPEMEWSSHDNSEVARWILRERGITLTGPPPADLLDPVPPQALRLAMAAQIPTALTDVLGWTTLQLAWSQRYTVATLCRMLCTWRTAQVVSKPQALRWAADELDPRWRPLLVQVLRELPLGWVPDALTPPELVEATVAFDAHVRGLVAG